MSSDERPESLSLIHLEYAALKASGGKISLASRRYDDAGEVCVCATMIIPVGTAIPAETMINLQLRLAEAEEAGDVAEQRRVLADVLAHVLEHVEADE